VCAQFSNAPAGLPSLLINKPSTQYTHAAGPSEMMMIMMMMTTATAMMIYESYLITT
jgi:hypothetical protein